MILLGEFDYAYYLDSTIGAIIIDEIAIWSGTNRGTMHKIISGYDKILPNLAFNQVKGLDLSFFLWFRSQQYEITTTLY